MDETHALPGDDATARVDADGRNSDIVHTIVRNWASKVASKTSQWPNPRGRVSLRRHDVVLQASAYTAQDLPFVNNLPNP